MSDRPTPETDALITLRSGFGVTDYEWRQHSRKLERQRDEVRELARDLRDALSKALDIPPGTVAVIKLPLPVKRLVALTAEMNATFGTGLYLREHPEGWLCFFNSTTTQES